MSCIDQYFNYGSYLRARGYEKSFCDFITSLQSGNVAIGPIEPNSYNTIGQKAVRIKENIRLDNFY